MVEVVLAASAILFLHTRGFAISTLLPVPSLIGSAVGVMLFLVAWVVVRLSMHRLPSASPCSPSRSWSSKRTCPPRLSSRWQ